MPQNVLRQFLKINNLPHSESLLTQFNDFADLLLRFNAKMNLIGPMNRSQIIETLFMDSLIPILLLHKIDLPLPNHLCDIGSGAGFPGVPIALLSQYLNPQATIHLVEPRRKRTQFLTILKHKLHLDNLQVHIQRVEEKPLPIMDLALSKAFQPPIDWIKTATPLIKQNGIISVLHSQRYTPDIKTFIQNSPDTYTLLLTLEELNIFNLTDTSVPRAASLIQKK